MEIENQSKSILKNIIYVLFSNVISVISGILVGFVIPKIMGVSDYGYYKTFTLYASYIGLFHFGFIDGIYLYYAGKKQEDLDKEQFRSYFRFVFYIELCMTILVTASSLFFLGNEYSYIFLFVGLDILAVNITIYYEFLTQITMRFKLLSVRSLIKSVVTIISVIILYLLYKFNSTKIVYSIYVIIVLGINYVLALWYVITYRKLTFGKCSGIKTEKENIKLFFKAGIPLLCANLIAQLIFIVDQQFVNILFDNDTYSTYAFAYSMINLITVATSAISTVLYPTLRNADENVIKEKYSLINSILLVFVSFCLCVYFILVPFVNTFLEEYILSLDIFRIILPGVLMSSSISVVKFNYYKNIRKINNYFIKSLIILILSIIANIIVYMIFKTTVSISIVSIFVLIIWYVLVEMYFVKVYKVKWLKNFIYMLMVLSLFYSITCASIIWLGLLIYVMVLLCLTLLLYYKELKIFIRQYLLHKTKE